MKRLESAIPPGDMWKGSCGTVVNVWLMAMQIWAKTHRIPAGGLVFDAVFGDIGVSLTKNFQYSYGLESDGGVGPATRAKAEEFLGFNFDALALAMGGETIFVDSHGEETLWIPTRVGDAAAEPHACKGAV